MSAVATEFLDRLDWPTPVFVTLHVFVTLIVVAWAILFWIESKPDHIGKRIVQILLALFMLNLPIYLFGSVGLASNVTSVPAAVLLVAAFGFLGGTLFFYRPPESSASPSESGKIAFGEGPAMSGLVGVAGAFTVFLVVEVPSVNDGSLESYLKLIGFSVVGGYGGIAIVKRAFTMVQADLQDQVKKLEEKTKADAELIHLVDRQLDLTKEATETSKLEAAMRSATERAVKFAYTMTYEGMREFDDEEGATGDRVDLGNRALQIYDAISRLYPKHYWASGQKGSCLLELEKYEDAIVALNEAIEQRKNLGKRPVYRYLERMEEAMLAENPNLDPTTTDGQKLLEGLRERLRPDYVKRFGSSKGWERIQDKRVVKWIAKNWTNETVAALMKHISDNGGRDLVDRIEKLKQS